MREELIPQPVPGDIVVTRVVDRYYIGRIEGDGLTVTTINIIRGESNARTFACAQVAGEQRVIMYDRAGSSHGVEVSC